MTKDHNMAPALRKTRCEHADPILRVADMALYREYQASGATIRQRPVNHSWALELQVEDPDGHVLRFGSEPLADRPFGSFVD